VVQHALDDAGGFGARQAELAMDDVGQVGARQRAVASASLLMRDPAIRHFSPPFESAPPPQFNYTYVTETLCRQFDILPNFRFFQ
jgi:hypothetical protein